MLLRISLAAVQYIVSNLKFVLASHNLLGSYVSLKYKPALSSVRRPYSKFFSVTIGPISQISYEALMGRGEVGGGWGWGQKCVHRIWVT